MIVLRPTLRACGLILIGLIACAVHPLGAAESRSPPGSMRSAPIGVGDQAPDFTLLDQDGRPHTLSEERPRQNAVVLIFYRGHW